MTASAASTPPPNHTWIAGAVAGPVFLLLLIIALLLYRQSKNLQKTKKQEPEDGGQVETKAQLHGDDIKPKAELAEPVGIKSPPAEFPANEVVVSEVDAEPEGGYPQRFEIG